MEFNVVYILTIYDEYRSNFTSGHKAAILPFAPFIGLEVLNSGIGFGAIMKISWDGDLNQFKCYLEHEVDPSDLDDDIEFQIEMAKRCGFDGFEKKYENPKGS